MKRTLTALLFAWALTGTGCSRSDKQVEKQPENVPESKLVPSSPADLRANVEKLHQAQMNAAAALTAPVSLTPASSPQP